MKTAGKFLIHAHWEDDDHVLREVGPMNYRVVEKRGIRLMRSPWLQARKPGKTQGGRNGAGVRAPHRQRGKCVGEAVQGRRPTRWSGGVDDRGGWGQELARAPDAQVDEAAAAHLIQTRARGIMDEPSPRSKPPGCAAAEARAAEEEAQELERSATKPPSWCRRCS